MKDFWKNEGYLFYTCNQPVLCLPENPKKALNYDLQLCQSQDLLTFRGCARSTFLSTTSCFHHVGFPRSVHADLIVMWWEATKVKPFDRVFTYFSNLSIFIFPWNFWIFDVWKCVGLIFSFLNIYSKHNFVTFFCFLYNFLIFLKFWCRKTENTIFEKFRF